MRLNVWTTALLLILVAFLIGCDGQTTQVTDNPEESSSSTTQETQEVSEEQPNAPESETSTTLRKERFTVVDESQGGRTGVEAQRFDSSILVTDKSDSSLIAAAKELSSHYSGHLDTFDAVNIYIFDDQADASEYLGASLEESVELDRSMIASYHLNNEQGLDTLYRYEGGKPVVLKEFSE